MSKEVKPIKKSSEAVAKMVVKLLDKDELEALKRELGEG